MCDMKRGHSLKLANEHETEEFRRIALRRKPRGIKGESFQSELSSGVCGSYKCATINDSSCGSEVNYAESRSSNKASELQTQEPATPICPQKGRQTGSNHTPISVELESLTRATENQSPVKTGSEANICLYDNIVKHICAAKSPLEHGALREGKEVDRIETLVPLTSSPTGGKSDSSSLAKEDSRNFRQDKSPPSWLHKRRIVGAVRVKPCLVEEKSDIVLIEHWERPSTDKSDNFGLAHFKTGSVFVDGNVGDKRIVYNNTPSTKTAPTREHTRTTKEPLKKGIKKKTLEEEEDGRKQKLYKIAMELLHTERAYVSRLHLLDQVFCVGLTEEAAKGSFPVEVVRTIFSNLSSIHSFHSQFLLPDLETRMSHWWEHPRLGDVMQKHAPFLRMYAEYVSNFDQAMELLRHWTDRSAAFRNIVLDIQSKDVCGSLTLQHHMLEPVQRVPRYEMLFRDYMGKLTEEDMDFAYAQKSLQTISMAAIHSNSAITKTEKLKKLLEIYEMLGDEEVVNPSNEFLKDGRLKLAAKSTSAADRHLFLFNNMVLCCTPRLSLVGQRFTVRTRIGIRGMQVQRLANVDQQNSFQVTGKGKTLDLQASSDQERDDWVKEIQKAIDVFHQNNETFKLANQDADVNELTECLGWRAPCLIRDNDVTMCMKCQEPFNNLSRRKQHCRACGCVVCTKCSDYKVALEYDGNKMNRVCRDCFSFFTGQDDVSETKKRGVNESDAVHVPGSTVMCGFLLYGDEPKTWTKMWCVIPRTEPLVLHLSNSPQSAQPLFGVLLLGSSVEDAPWVSDLQASFHLFHSSSVHTFTCDSPELKQYWLDVLRVAAKRPSIRKYLTLTTLPKKRPTLPVEKEES